MECNVPIAVGANRRTMPGRRRLYKTRKGKAVAHRLWRCFELPGASAVRWQRPSKAETQRSNMTKLNRRQALAGLASAAGLSGTSAIASAPSKAAELIADYEWATAAYEDIAGRLEDLELRHRELMDDWPAVEVGFGAPPQRFPLGIDDIFDRQSSHLLDIYGADAGVTDAIEALGRLRDRAKSQLAKLTEDHAGKLEACGIAALQRELNQAFDKQQECWRAILAYDTATTEEAAIRDRFLLRYVAQYPADDRVADVWDMLFGDSAGSVSAG